MQAADEQQSPLEQHRKADPRVAAADNGTCCEESDGLSPLVSVAAARAARAGAAAGVAVMTSTGEACIANSIESNEEQTLCTHMCE